MLWIVGVWCLVLSLWELLLCGWDKRAAQKGLRRTPERRLLTLALLGGGPGLWLGMALFRHKTRHWTFCLAAPLTTLLWAGLLLWLGLPAQP